MVRRGTGGGDGHSGLLLSRDLRGGDRGGQFSGMGGRPFGPTAWGEIGHSCPLLARDLRGWGDGYMDGQFTSSGGYP